MFVIRLYLAALTLTLLLTTLATSGVEVLTALVIICPLLYMILELREDLRELKSLEALVGSLSR
ncbi:MAG: hypothetical protein H0T45_02290 [Pyrinomonadaceae bacterium]|nr:hypothetical protein [Pyrinomonadaceae bacterium]MDQ3252311.1 hypothetical protein [Acidobacteriota bacterium]